MIDFRSFEAFEGVKPFRLLDRHPDGLHLAMQVATADAYLATVWNNETKQMVWAPEDAHSLAWLQQGTQIAALQNPLLSGDFLFSLYTWPQGRLIQQCSLVFPMGYLFDLRISPASDFAVCQWTDQGEFGFEFIGINAQEVIHLARNGYIQRNTNISTRPVFRPDEHIWVCCYQDNPSWTKEDQRKIGAVMVFHETQKQGEIPIMITLPAAYVPQNLNTPALLTEEHLYIGDPVFLDEHHVQIRLPSGEIQVHALH